MKQTDLAPVLSEAKILLLPSSPAFAPQLLLKNFGYEEAFRASPYTAFLYNINQHPTIVRLKQFYSKNLNYKL